MKFFIDTANIEEIKEGLKLWEWWMELLPIHHLLPKKKKDLTLLLKKFLKM